jgi:hypothetical protein
MNHNLAMVQFLGMVQLEFSGPRRCFGSMGSALSLESQEEASDERDAHQPRLFAVDECGARVPLLDGDSVRLLHDEDGRAAGVPAACGSGRSWRPATLPRRLHVVRVHGEQVVLRESGASGEAAEETVNADRLVVVNEGVTLARFQLRQLLRLYFARCTTEACSPHEGFVEAVEHSISAAHTGYAEGRMCLDLAGRRLGDTELELINSALAGHHGPLDDEETPAEAESSDGVEVSADAVGVVDAAGLCAGCQSCQHDGTVSRPGEASCAACRRASETLASLSSGCQRAPKAAAARARLSEVRVVDVSQNRISGEGASALCALIARDMPMLEELYLDSNNISDTIQDMFPAQSGRGGQQTLAAARPGASLFLL